MIDNIIMVISNVKSEDFNCFLSKLSSYEIVQIEEVIVKLDWKNMRVVYYPKSKTLEIKNSLHKLYNLIFGNGKADNSTDFTLSQFQAISYYICQLIEKDNNEIVLRGRFEFGVNVEINRVNPTQIFQRYLSYKSKRIIPFETVTPRRGKAKHRTCFMSDYRIKAYQKDTLEVGVKTEKNKLRFEIVTTELRKLRNVTGLKEITIANMLHQDMWNRLAEFILESYDKIQKVPIVKTETALWDIAEITLYCSETFYHDMKVCLPETKVKQLRHEQKEIYEKWNKSDLNEHVLIRNDLKSKLEYITSN